MQESRLFKIIYHLLEKGTSTAPELAEKFEVSVRTIYRDIDAISGAGIPIYATQGKGGGITISKDFILDKSLLSTTEKEQVLMALQGLIATEGSHSGELLTKLGSLFQVQNTSWIEVDFSNWARKHVNQDTFNLLKHAIFGRNIAAFQYFGSNQKLTTRNVAPLKLIFKSKDWYLYGFCLLRNDYRFFKLTRMKDLKIQEETYSRDIAVPQTIIRLAQIENTVPALLKFDQRIAFRVYDEFADEVTTDDYGNLYVRTDLPDNDMLYSYLLSFENHVEVMEPPEIRERFKEKLSDISKKYRT